MPTVAPPPELTMTAWLRFGAVRRCLAYAHPQRVLEVGMGEGALGVWLAEHYDYTGVEPDDESRAVAEERLRIALRGDARADLTEVDNGPFDIVCAFEVLEHIEDDRKALATWRSQLVPGGYLLLSVPAHSDAFGPGDEYVGHFRRYERAQLRELLAGEGYEVVRWRTYGAGLGQAVDAMRNAILRRRKPATTNAERSGGSGRLFQPRGRARAYANYMIALPFRGIQIPFARSEVGIGYVVLARARR